MISEYPRGYMFRIAILDSITCIIGLIIFCMPFIYHMYPGGYDTMLHIFFGATIAVLGFFRAALAYASHWIEIVLIPLGLFVLLLPKWLSMQWDPSYNTPHIVLGAAVMFLAVVSGIMTIVEMPKIRAARR